MKMIVDYKKRLVEVDEILNYLNQEEYKKISKEVIQAIKDNKDNEYNWKYDETKELKDQDVSKDTIAILSYLNTKYLLNEEQRKVMEQIHQINEYKYQKELSKKINFDNIFKNDASKTNVKQESIADLTNESVSKNTELIEIKENIFQKIIRKIRNFFDKRSKR